MLRDGARHSFLAIKIRDPTIVNHASMLLARHFSTVIHTVEGRTKQERERREKGGRNKKDVLQTTIGDLPCEAARLQLAHGCEVGHVFPLAVQH